MTVLCSRDTFDVEKVTANPRGKKLTLALLFAPLIDVIPLFFNGAIYYHKQLRAYVGCRASLHRGRAPVGSSWVVVAGGLTGVDFIPHGIKHGTESTHTSPYRPYFTTYFINLIERAS